MTHKYFEQKKKTLCYPEDVAYDKPLSKTAIKNQYQIERQWFLSEFDFFC